MRIKYIFLNKISYFKIINSFFNWEKKKQKKRYLIPKVRICFFFASSIWGFNDFGKNESIFFRIMTIC